MTHILFAIRPGDPAPEPRVEIGDLRYSGFAARLCREIDKGFHGVFGLCQVHMGRNQNKVSKGGLRHEIRQGNGRSRATMERTVR